MHDEIEVTNIYSMLKDVYSRNEFQSEIKRVQDDFASLLDRKTAALFLLAENRRLQIGLTPIGSLKSDGELVTVEGKVVHVEQPHEFTRKDGSTGNVVSLILSDSTGEIRVSFWENKDIEKVEAGDIRIGTKLRIINGRVRINSFGKNINVGGYAMVKVI